MAMPSLTRHRLSVLIVAILVSLQSALAAAEEYVRPVDVAPSEEDIGEGYRVPPSQRAPRRADWWWAVDAAALAAALAASTFLVLWKRSRSWIIGLTVACLIYFGFYREGCVCPIGAIQNVAVALL